MYNEEPGDNQIIDLIVDVGYPFSRTVNGNEVELNLGESHSDRPLITVDIREHIGRRSNIPFSVDPLQQVCYFTKSNNREMFWC